VTTDLFVRLEPLANSFTKTVSSPKLPLESYLQLLRLKGQFVQVGLPEDIVPGFHMFPLILKRVSIAGSLIGSPQDIKDMLKLFVEKDVRTWNVNVPMKDANQVVKDMDAGKARYRYVLVNEED
jgi:alcohol dehydrogenase (NADP+)